MFIWKLTLPIDHDRLSSNNSIFNFYSVEWSWIVLNIAISYKVNILLPVIYIYYFKTTQWRRMYILESSVSKTCCMKCNGFYVNYKFCYQWTVIFHIWINQYHIQESLPLIVYWIHLVHSVCFLLKCKYKSFKTIYTLFFVHICRNIYVCIIHFTWTENDASVSVIICIKNEEVNLYCILIWRL